MKEKIEPLDLAKYIIGYNVGTSACTIMAHYFNLEYPSSIPLDSDDLGRCMKICELFGWDDISFMKNYNGIWAQAWNAIADNWELFKKWYADYTKGYEPSREKTNNLLDEIRRATPKPKNCIIIGPNGIE